MGACVQIYEGGIRRTQGDPLTVKAMPRELRVTLNVKARPGELRVTLNTKAMSEEPRVTLTVEQRTCVLHWKILSFNFHGLHDTMCDSHVPLVRSASRYTPSYV